MILENENPEVFEKTKTTQKNTFSNKNNISWNLRIPEIEMITM